MDFPTCSPTAALGAELPEGVCAGLDCVVLGADALRATPLAHVFEDAAEAKNAPAMHGILGAEYAATGARVRVRYVAGDLDKCDCGGWRLPRGGDVIVQAEAPDGARLGLRGHQRSAGGVQVGDLPGECVPVTCMVFVRHPCVVIPDGNPIAAWVEYWLAPSSEALGMLRERGIVVPRADGSGRDVYFCGEFPIGVAGSLEG